MYSKNLIFFLLLLVFAGCGRKGEPQAGRPDEINKFFFLCSAEGKPSVYSYDIPKRKPELFWTSKREKVIEVLTAPDGRSIFFLTAADFGKKTIFPYITRLRIYKIDTDSLKAEKLRDLGNCIQIFTKWTGPQTFRIIYNSFDTRKSTFINQYKLVFNANGELLTNEKVTYDIVKEKYPVPANDDYSESHGDNYKSSILLGKYRIHDEIIKGRPGILIYDTKTNKTIDTVDAGKSCGIRNIYTILN